MSDQAQRDKALDVTQSFIVQAPAGSGKTELLTQRYLKLLSVCDEPENVMAMTFTNKAVDELIDRVLSSLKSTENPRPEQTHKQITYGLALKVIERSKKNNWQLLETPQRLKIFTIDGLSSLISGRYPTRSQLVTPRIMTQDWERKKAYHSAAEQTLLMIGDEEHNQAISSLLLYLDNNIEKFYRLTTSMLAKRDQWLTRLYRGDALDPSILRDSASKIIIQHLSCLEKEAKQHINQDFFDLIAVNTKDEYAQIQSLPASSVEDLSVWKMLSSLCLKKDGLWRKSLNKNNGFPPEIKTQKQEFEKILQELSKHKSLTELLGGVNQLPDIDFSKLEIQALEDIAQVLKLCVAQLNLLFDSEQAHDFIEVALRANHTLDEHSNVSDMALFLDYKVQHILIDEFQDTSASQFNLVKKLIHHWQVDDGRTLFLVGDPMQSIYRFRESQVGLFLQVKAVGIASIAPKSLKLTTNFRSSKSIVERNNVFFKKIFPNEEDIYQGAIGYSSSISNSDLTNDQAIVFHPFTHSQYQAEADLVLEIINDSLSKNPKGEIAILVRGRSHLSDIVDVLKAHSIDFESIKTTALKDHILTRGLLSLTKALLHLGDKLAWLSVLRAPWCGLLLEDLLVFSKLDDCIIYEQLSSQKVLDQLTKDGQKRAKHIAQSLKGAIDNQVRFNFVEILTHAIDQLGISQSLSLQEVMIKDQFLQIIFDCESQQLLNIETIEAILEDLYAPSKTAQVKLMTIHESKGLEFDTVIIPGLGRKPRSDDAPIIRMKEFSNQSLLLAPIKSFTASDDSNTYNYLKFVDSQQNKFETMRLLYVAMTRAKNNLHLLGALTKGNKANAKSLLDMLMQFYEGHFDDVDADNAQDTTKNIDTPKLERFVHLKSVLQNKVDQGESVEYNKNFEILFKSLLGTLVHQYYEQEVFNPDRKSIEIKLIEIGVSPTDVDQYVRHVLKLLNNTKQDSQFEWLFKQRESTLVEAEFINGDTVIAIDRLFIYDDVLWIIDFKTASLLDDESEAQFIQRQKFEHTKQLLFYQEVLSKIYNNDIKCALYCPAISQLIEIEH